MPEVARNNHVHSSYGRNSHMSGIICYGRGNHPGFHILQMEIARLVFIIVYSLEAVPVNQSEKPTPIRWRGLLKFRTNKARYIPLKETLFDLLEELCHCIHLGSVSS